MASQRAAVALVTGLGALTLLLQPPNDGTTQPAVIWNPRRPLPVDETRPTLPVQLATQRAVGHTNGHPRTPPPSFAGIHPPAPEPVLFVRLREAPLGTAMALASRRAPRGMPTELLLGERGRFATYNPSLLRVRAGEWRVLGRHSNYNYCPDEPAKHGWDAHVTAGRGALMSFVLGAPLSHGGSKSGADAAPDVADSVGLSAEGRGRALRYEVEWELDAELNRFFAANASRALSGAEDLRVVPCARRTCGHAVT